MSQVRIPALTLSTLTEDFHHFISIYRKLVGYILKQATTAFFIWPFRSRHRSTRLRIVHAVFKWLLKKQNTEQPINTEKLIWHDECELMLTGYSLSCEQMQLLLYYNLNTRLLFLNYTMSRRPLVLYCTISSC